jgi:hypothetical protein
MLIPECAEFLQLALLILGKRLAAKESFDEVSSESLSPNGWTLANIVQTNIDIVSKILNGHLPTPQDLVQASEPMTKKGALPQRLGSEPANNIPATSSIIPTREPVEPLPPEPLPPAPPGNRADQERDRCVAGSVGKEGSCGKHCRR